MRRTGLLFAMAGGLFGGLPPLASAAPEAWADPALPVIRGLELWLDVATEPAARRMNKLPPAEPGQALAIWHDGSGEKRHFTQWTEAARPHFEATALHFHAGSSLAAAISPALEAREITVFVVASTATPEGDFPSLLSLAALGETDFTSGLNLDFGRHPAPSGTIATVNCEGAGQAGEVNLLPAPLPADRGHLLTLAVGERESRLRVDSTAQGSRPRENQPIRAARVAVGARFVAPEMRHFLRGAVAEVLVYNRLLNEAEIEEVERHLRKKHTTFLRQQPPRAPRPTGALPDVQMLLPGFEVRELPLRLSNLNNVEYAPDGRLFAGGYDGRFHLLRDSDGDGLEDEVITFSPEISDDYPLGMVVKEGMPHALLADSIIRFRDTNGDGVPDRRETVVSGWDDPALREDPSLMHRRVDSALGLATGPGDAWFITMGSANPGNGYWQEMNDQDQWDADAPKTGKPRYSPELRRGCLLRIDPDGRVTHLASGLRYVMSLQRDPHGELFGTDQEGATWLPNGNPFDELLHLQPGRHYGFPPRHPQLLPGVIDEPSVWDFAPQHQSACGFRFNGPTNGRGRFGPPGWEHDALVTGASRGKLWRVSLARTRHGYVARAQQIAALSMIAVDCALSPTGELVVCCHSGPPDWGTGPAGLGRLFKIRWTGMTPLPVNVWAASPTETIVEFDQALPSDFTLATEAEIEAGSSVTAGDRFETIRPGYAVVDRQQAAPRLRVRVESAHFRPDRRQLLLSSETRRRDLGYGLHLPTARHELGIPQAGSIDLDFRLNGLEARWQGESTSAHAVIPHPDPTVVRQLGTGSRTQSEFLKHLKRPGVLTLDTRLRLDHMLTPPVQPGSRLDYEPLPETVTVTLVSDRQISLTGRGFAARGKQVRFTREISPGEEIQNLEISLPTPVERLEISFHTGADPERERPLGLNRFLLPFAEAERAVPLPDPDTPPLRGDPARGKALFFGKASCSTCHQMHGAGVAVGPDLSNSSHRGYEALLRDITDPNATINPDAVAYSVTLADGREFMGVRLGDTADELRLVMPGGKVSALPKAQIQSTTALSVSLMPAGLLDDLNQEEIDDLMSYLLAPR